MRAARRCGFRAAILLGLGLAAPVPGAGAGAGAPPPPPLQFHSEVVRLDIGVDSLTVEGIYRLVCRRDPGGTAPLLYPYPVDDRMGGARTVSLEGRAPGGGWRSMPFREVAGGLGAVWTIPLDRADTLDVRTMYRQALTEAYARYIVTTTSTWKRPLERASFEIRLPRGAEPEAFSFPFSPADCPGRPCYRFEATRFLPDHDIVVRWRTREPRER